LLNQLREQIELYSCSGGIYTQTTDVEGEVNGLMTYDRRIIRMNEEQWKTDVTALYSAAAVRAKNAYKRGVMKDVSQGGMQFGIP
jgi:predicted DNA-binding transcriptional regulator